MGADSSKEITPKPQVQKFGITMKKDWCPIVPLIREIKNKICSSVDSFDIICIGIYLYNMPLFTSVRNFQFWAVGLDEVWVQQKQLQLYHKL